MSQQGFHFGAEDEPAAGKGVIKRSYAQPVSRQEQLLFTGVPNGDRELAIEVVQAVRAVILVQVQDDFRVAVGGEAMPAPLQFRAQFDVVEHLAVEDDPQAAVFIADRLVAAGEVDDAQAGVAKPHVRIAVHAESVRAAVPNHAQHAQQYGRLNGRLIRQV